MTPKQLNYLLYRLSSQRRYRVFELQKRAGGTRTIRAPILPLKKAQSQVAALLAVHYTPRSCVFGYVKDRNILLNANRHVAKRWVLRVDLKDFFPSIHFGRVRGMLLAQPFGLPDSVATTLAQICCDQNELPQGSPASPLISNIVCRGLDRALAKLARAHRCSYTRYCDDLVFSTNRRTFPAALALFDADASPPRALVGPALEKEITRAGFHINPDKVRLRPGSHRQMVTGIVTNARINVPRQYVRDLRMILHVWKQHGPEAASVWYLTNHDKRNRPPGKKAPEFQAIVRGRLQYLGSVRGWNDPVYVRLGNKLASLDPQFKLTRRVTSKPPPDLALHVYVEGRTDKRHMEMALSALQAKGRFRDLKLVIEDKDRGSTELLKLCRSFAERLQTAPCLFVFDSDEKGVVPQVTDSTGDAKDWGNSVYSLVIPRPPHRPNDERICIELLYSDTDLRRADDQGRRIFLGAEFRQQTGRHNALDAYTTVPNKNSLVIEDHVFDFKEKKLALSKSGFTTLIRQNAAVVSFDGFVPLFEQLVAIRKRIADG
jgi:RNA-directed DNA polymerase